MAKVCTYCGYTAPRKDPELKRHGAPDGCFSHLSDLVPVLKRELRKSNEWHSDGFCAYCPWCGTGKDFQHAPDCPVPEAEEMLK
jgi:hypothetical protein